MQSYHLLLALLMLVTGSINTLSVKWADTMTSESTDHVERGFRHPFLQACGMFLGEMFCMVAFVIVTWYRRRRARINNIEPEPELPRYNPFIFLPPALCDMTATSVQYIGLTLTYASSFQMLRGAVIIFTGLLSMLFLRRRLQIFRWIGILFVIGGLVTVGVCDLIYITPSNSTSAFFNKEYFGALIGGNTTLHLSDSDHSSSDILLGDILIVCAQVIVASQMVYEEKFISKYNVPALQAVGWEGTFGFLTLSTLLIPMYFIPVGGRFGDNPRHVLEDAYDGLYQLAHNPLLATAFCGTVISIAFFNFAGISVTKEMSATTRMVLDSVRTLVIWGVSLGVGWQVFHLLQLLGFFILVCGMCIYNDLIIGPLCRKLYWMYRERYAPIENVPDEPEEERETTEEAQS